MKFRLIDKRIDHINKCDRGDKDEVAETNHQDGPSHFQVTCVDLSAVLITEKLHI